MDKNCDENKCILVNIYNNMLSIELFKYNEQLPIINTLINLKVRISFSLFKIADYYIKQYVLQQYFIVFKAKFEIYNNKTFQK